MNLILFLKLFHHLKKESTCLSRRTVVPSVAHIIMYTKRVQTYLVRESNEGLTIKIGLFVQKSLPKKNKKMKIRFLTFKTSATQKKFWESII